MIRADIGNWCPPAVFKGYFAIRRVNGLVRKTNTVTTENVSLSWSEHTAAQRASFRRDYVQTRHCMNMYRGLR